MIKIGAWEIAADGTYTFPDGTLSVKLHPIFAEANKVIMVSWFYESDAELFTLICIRRHYQQYGMDLYMPYCPHARMDRVKNEEDVFTLKYFCEVINSLNFKHVYIVDAHSNVAPALLDRVVNLSPKDDIMAVKKIISEINPQTKICMFYPDEGAMKRYSDMIKMPYAYGLKKRRWEDGEILGLDIIHPELIEGKDILIVDDICSKGGTFYYAAKALKEAGAANIYLFVSHCEKTIFEGKIFSSGLIDHAYTTHSIFKPEWQTDKITIIE